MLREFICNGCNKKCIISLYNSNYNTIKGNQCNLGIDYAKIMLIILKIFYYVS
ncbi:hypothetical protein JTS93_15240 [Clostridium botulinum]|nr:hypothetical protein [Clostridium botulinum]